MSHQPSLQSILESFEQFPSLILENSNLTFKAYFNLGCTNKSFYNNIFFSTYSVNAIRNVLKNLASIEGIDINSLSRQSLINYAKDHQTKLDLTRCITERQHKLIFLTSPAGSGKTHILNELCQDFEVDKGQYQTGFTGTSSTMLPNGRTLHSLFNFLIPYTSFKSKDSPYGVRTDDEGKYITTLAQKKIQSINTRIQQKNLDFRGKQLKNRMEVLAKIEDLRIDEISMVPYSFFMFLSECMKEIKGSVEPWGGIRVIMSGDFCQLKPVCTSDNPDDGRFVLDVPWWKECVKVFHLRFSYRQSKDPSWARVCSDIRFGKIGIKTIDVINSRRLDGKYITEEEEENITYIYEHNVDVDSHNRKMISRNKGKEFRIHRNVIVKKPCDKGYFCEVPKPSDARFDKYFIERSDFPAHVDLKITSKIMVTRNIDASKGIVNGTIGTVLNFNDKAGVTILLKNGSTYLLGYASREVKETCGCVINVEGVPIKPSYAFTVHKCQGMTLPNGVRACITNNTAHDKFYTLVTRTPTADGISFPMSFSPNIVGQDKTVMEFYNIDRITEPFVIGSKEGGVNNNNNNNNNSSKATNHNNKNCLITKKDWLDRNELGKRYRAFIMNNSTDVIKVHKKRKIEVIEID